MKKAVLSFSIFLLLIVGFVTDVSAKDMSRRFGLGVDSSLSNFNGDGRGISIVYNINKFFAIQAIFSIEMQKAEINISEEEDLNYAGEYTTNIIDWNVSVRGIIPFVLASDVNLGAVVGFTANGRASDGFKSKNDDYSKQFNDGYNFSIDLALRPEWFVSEHFSIHTQVGIAIDILTKDGSAMSTALAKDRGHAIPTTEASGAHISFFSNGDFFGQAGFTFWF